MEHSITMKEPSLCTLFEVDIGEDMSDGDYIHKGMTRKIKEPTKELTEYAESHREAVMEILANDISKLDPTAFKAFMEDIIKTMNQQEYVELHRQYYDSFTAGCQTGIILNDGNYKRSLSKHPKWINIYRNNRFAPINKVKRVKEHHLIEMLIAKYKLDMNTALLLDKSLARVTNKDEDDGIRYAKDTGGSYAKLSEDVQRAFFEEYTYIDNKDVKQIGYITSDDSDIGLTATTYIAQLECKDKPEKADKNKEQYLQVYLGAYSKMSNYIKLHLLRNLVYVEHYILYVKMQHKQEIGNHGRRYNILDEIPRIDRDMMFNLYGVDMESALQTILYTKVKSIEPTIEIPFTEYYIANKKQVRKDISQQMGWTTDRAKTEITAIYQGRRYNSKKYENRWHKELEYIFLERDRIREVIFTTSKDNTQVTKYATKRTNEKIKEDYNINDAIKKYNTLKAYDKANIKNTYMFYYWTYFEREIQNIIAKEFKYPKRLHDAVYTQDKDDFDKLHIESLEKEILSTTGTPIKLSID